MKPDILFWFYRDFDLCAQRLRLLRVLNPQVRIYGLYGGPLEQAAQAERELAALMDDLYAFPEDRESEWKWQNGDLLIARWHKERGQHLPWETLFVHQWDIAAMAPMEQLFKTLQPGEILLSGFTPLSTVSSWWFWAQPSNQDFQRFVQYLREFYPLAKNDLYACLFVVVCLPRVFMDKFVACGPPSIGFLEYKIPTMARIFDVPLCLNHPFEPDWNPDHDVVSGSSVLNATSKPIPNELVSAQLDDPNGQRLFHPIRQTLPDSWIVAVTQQYGFD